MRRRRASGSSHASRSAGSPPSSRRGWGVSFLIAGHLRRRAEAVATFHAGFVVESVLAPVLTPSDLSRPITGSRYQQLRSLVEDRILSDGRDVRVKIWNPDGTIIFSDDPALVGRVFSDEQPSLRQVMAGAVRSDISDLSDPENLSERGLASRLFETYVPVRLEPGGKVLAVAEVYQSYGAIQTDANQLFRTLALTFGLGLMVLYLAMLPIALRASRSLRRQNTELRRQAEQLATASEELQESFAQLRANDEQRRLLLERVVSVQEEERKRIAEDIHDDSLQKVTALGLRLGILRRQLSDPAQLAAIDQLQASLDAATARLRYLLFELHPRSLNSGSLADGLREYLHEVSGDGVAYELENHLVDEPPLETRIVAFRIAQEALSNVRKHAEATRVTVTLAPRDRGFLVRIEDDGAGFDATALELARPGHLGLASMHERAEVAGGWCKVESSPGSGCRVECWLPNAA
jgi:signal transduction histidine kinase